MNTRDVLEIAGKQLHGLKGHTFDLLTLSQPVSVDAAVNLAKIISKLSPLLGNLIEFNTVEFLNATKQFQAHGTWKRQDPGFPDAVFDGSVVPIPGFEIKAWFPLATEITARFKDSQNHFIGNNTNVVLLAWLPEHLLFGKPYILDVCIVPAASVAKARDDHYHNPPDYLVLEPGDTSSRTANLRQTNTCGYKWQGSSAQAIMARETVKAWGTDSRLYQPTREYQELLRELTSTFEYRLDTNFAKMDRIAHAEIEEFKARVNRTIVHGLSVRQWQRHILAKSDVTLRAALAKHLAIT